MKIPRWFCLLSISLIIYGCASRGFPPAHQIPNFDQLETGYSRYYRGGQPSLGALASLKETGVRTVVNLRQPGDTLPAEEEVCRALGMAYVAFPMNDLQVASPEQLDRLARLLSKEVTLPVFVHCRYGCERTGEAMFLVRRTVYGWSAETAWQEAKSYGLSPFFGPKSALTSWPGLTHD